MKREKVGRHARRNTLWLAMEKFIGSTLKKTIGKASERRAIAVFFGLVVFGIGLGAILYAFRSHIVFFYSPTEFMAQHQSAGLRRMERLRLSGLVEKGSLYREGALLSFRITDGQHALPVIFSGIPPRLFKEGHGAVVEGTWNETEKRFHAQRLLIKHDEVYAPSKNSPSSPCASTFSSDDSSAAVKSDPLKPEATK